MKNLSDSAAVHEACLVGVAQTAVGGSHLSVVASSQVEVPVPLYHALAPVRQQPVYNRSHVLDEALERLMVVVVFAVPVSAAEQLARTVAALGLQTGVPAAGLLLLLAHLLSFAFHPLHLVVHAADAAVQVCSTASCVHVKAPLAAGCHSDVVQHHAMHFFAVAQEPAAVYLFVAAVCHAASASGSVVAAVMTVQAAAELAQQVDVVQHLPVGPVPAYNVGTDATRSLTDASVATVSAAD